jgi:predicted NBD/HSP70 family sugar kinase
VTHPPVSRPDAIRRHNLGLLLAEIHRDGELTRAQLTERLKLSRSTIGALVSDLSVLGLVDERVPSGGDRAGRPSHVVAPRADGPYVVAVDIDITDLTIAAVGIGGNVLARRVTPTSSSPPSVEQVARDIASSVAALVTEVPGRHEPVGIGVSVPGTVNLRTGLVEFAPNLDWRDVAVRDAVAALVPARTPVSVGNDADLAVRAEHLRGNARQCDDVVYLMARIGVGAGIIANGRPLYGHAGLAGEVGHNVLDASGPLCHCGKRGCVETYIGEAALLQLAGRDEPASAAAAARVFADATSGDACAAAAIRTVGDALGRVLASLVNTLNPQRILLGGSLAAILDFAPEHITAALDQHVLGGLHGPLELLAPQLGEDSTLLGAAELAFGRLLADPLTAR